MLDHLNGTTFGDAGSAHSGVSIGNRAGTDQAARPEAPGQRRVSNQLMKAEMHGTALGMTEPLTVPFNLQRQVHAPVAPGLAQLVGGDRHRGKTGRGLGLDKTEAGLHFLGGRAHAG